MSRKAFHVGIDLDIHAVTCPGVWLCPKGDAMLQVSMLGISRVTNRIEPTFPLLFHESFHFRKTFTGISTLSALQKEFEKQLVRLQLLQWQVHGCQRVLLAVYCSPLSELLYPQHGTHGQYDGVDVNLLMETTPCFPGIISPKVEISTKVVIEEMINYQNHDQGSRIISIKTLSSKKECKRETTVAFKSKTKNTFNCAYNSKIRQKPVCHTKPKVKCYYCKRKVGNNVRVQRTSDDECTGGKPFPCSTDHTTYTPYCIKCGDFDEVKLTKNGKIMPGCNSKEAEEHKNICLCSEAQKSKSNCECSLCCKYNRLFNNTSSSLSAHVSMQNSKLMSEKLESWLSLPQKKVTDKYCPCLLDKLEDESKESIEINGRWDIENPKDYKKLFKADIDSYYNKLYQRVSRRSNSRAS